MKKIAKFLFALSLFYSGKFKKEISHLKQQSCIIGVYGHEIEKEQFEKYIKWLLKHEFEFATLQDVIDYLNGESKIDTCKIWISLDDGWRSNLELIPIIEKYNTPLTLFIPTYPVETGFYRDTLENKLTEYLPDKFKDNVKLLMEIPENERWEIDADLYKQAKGNMQREAITVEELKKIAQHPLISIGAHTHTHPVLSKCSTVKIKEEIELNLSKIEGYTGLTPELLALPNGNYDDRVLEMVLHTKIKHIASIESGKILSTRSRLPVPRNGIAIASFYENCCRMLDFWHPNVKKLNSFFKI